MRYQAAFGIESWYAHTHICRDVVAEPLTSSTWRRYEELKEHTFYTKSLPLSYEEAKALSKYHYSLGPHQIGEPLTDEVVTVLHFGESLNSSLNAAWHVR